MGAYGIAAASLVYFDKSVNELTIAEAAYLAALPKAPSSLHPVRNRDRAIERRNYVVDRMLENGWIKQADADKARKDPLIVTSSSRAQRTSSPANILPRKSAATSSNATARRSSMKAACRSAPRSIPSCR